jgi:hypothetical protein
MRRAIHPRVAIALLPATLIVPLISSPLRGLTHIPACHIQPGDPVTVAPSTGDESNDPESLGDPQGSEIAASAITLESPEDTEAPCPGIELLLNVTADSSGATRVAIPVNNNSSGPVTATAEVHVGQITHVISIGRILPGTARVKFLLLPKSPKETSVSVGLFVGPS